MFLQKIFRRTGLSLLTLFLAVSFSFFLIHLVPGDPIDFILGEQSGSIERLKLQQSLGLDKNLSQQYKTFLAQLIKGDMGQSLHSRLPVQKHLRDSLPATFQLAVLSLLLAMLWGLPVGFLSAIKKGRVDLSLSVFSLLTMSLPAFVLAPILIWTFSVQLSLLPVSDLSAGLRSFVLPALSLALPLGAVLVKMSRASFLEIMNQNYVRTAQAKGLSFKAIHFKHILKNALTPIITVLGLQMGALLTGTVIIESIFDWPGLGLLLLESIYRRDYPVVQGCVLLIAVIYVLVNLLVDIMYIWTQPKIRFS